MRPDFISESICQKIPLLQTECTIVQLPKIDCPPAKKTRFPELDLFRQQIEQGKACLHHQPYTNSKKNTLIYKAIFLSFSALFVLLSVLTVCISFAYSWGIFNLTSIGIVKTALVLFCALLAFSSFFIGISLRTEREAIQCAVRRARARTSRIYARKRIQFGINQILPFSRAKRQMSASLKNAYRDTCEKISDRKDEALHLVQRIISASLAWSEKEMLLNQAIENLSEQLFLLTHSFRILKI
jgi:hypothetical protein